MKVFILAHNFKRYESGKLIYAEANRQDKDVEIRNFNMRFNTLLEDIKIAEPDYIFVTGSRSFTPKQFKQLKEIAKLVIWDADGIHINERDRIWQALSGIPDIVFSVISNINERYPKLSNNTIWMPQFYDDITFKPTVQRDRAKFTHDVIFLGEIDPRTNEWLLKLKNRGYKVAAASNVFGTAMANAYTNSAITFGRFIPDPPLNEKFTTSNRIYNAMGCGSFYLLHPVGDVESMFKPGKHLDVYDGTYEDLEKKIDYYLKNPEERERIAKAGQEEILKKHSLKVRIGEYWDLMENYIK